jgi:hypothetical protein
MKKGPPYLDNPHATYIVIDHPWGQGGQGKRAGYLNNVGAWVRYMSRHQDNCDPTKDVLVQMIYTRKNVSFLDILIDGPTFTWIVRRRMPLS